MDSTVHTRDLEAVRRRRADLRLSLGAVEHALASPAAGRAVIWGEIVHRTLEELAEEFAEHIDVTEGPDGLHDAILAAAPRLGHAVQALTAEHGDIRAEIAALLTATEPPVTPDDVADVREQGTRLLGHVVRHRQRGADLVYEAYETDLGAGD
jgi:hypothetical protein